MRKKILALVLALVMVVAMLPTVAFAYTQSATDLAKLIAPGSSGSYDTTAVKVDGNTVTLLKALSVSQDIALWGSADLSEITLDVGEYTLTLSGDSQISVAGGMKLKITGTKDKGKIVGTTYSPIYVICGSSVTVENVTISYNGNSYAIAVDKPMMSVGDGVGATIVLDSVKVETQWPIGILEENTNLTIKGDSTINATTGSGVVVTKGSTVTLENGTITGKGTGVTVGAYSQNYSDGTPGKLIVKGGEIKAADGNGFGINASYGSTVEISGGKVSGQTGIIAKDGSDVKIGGNADIDATENGVDVRGVDTTYGNTNKPATVTISGGTIDGRYGAVAYAGGQLTVSGGEVTGTAAGIGTNGSDKSADTTVNVTGGKVTGTIAGVYLPSGNMTVSGEAEISGKAGIVVRGGDLDVQGGTVKATGTATDKVAIGDAKDAGGQATQVPVAAITVDIGADYPQQGGGQKHVTVSGDAKVEAPADGQTLAAYNKTEEVKPDAGGKVKPEENPFDIKGGTLKVDDKPDKENVSQFLTTGYEYTDGEITEDTETTAKFEAEIVDGLKYETLEEALTHVVKGNTIKLLNNVELPGTMKATEAEGRIEVKNEITIDLNGNTVKKAEVLTEDKAGMLIGENGNLTITDTTGTGTITGKGTLLLVNNASGALTIEDGVTITQGKGADDNNDTAVATNGGILTINGGTIDAAESGVGVFGKGQLTVTGGTINAASHGITANGSATNADAKITITGGTIKATNGAGVYLPKGGLEMSEGSVSGAAGIVVRGGKATVTGGTVEATSAEETVEIGDANPATVAPAAVVVDRSNSYGEGTAELSGGEFKATEGKDAVVYSESGENKSTTDANANEKLTVKGGYYSSSLAETKLLDPSLNTEAETTEGEYSYFTSPAEAEKQLAEDNKTAAENGITVIDATKASIVKVGFLTEKDDDYLNSLTTLVTDGGEPWKEGGITDSGKNTFYAVFKAGEGDNSASYTVKFTVTIGNEEKAYTETVTGVNKGGIVYFTPSNQGSGSNNIPTENFQGEYTVTLTKQSESTAVSTATLEVYKVTYKAGEKVDGTDKIIYVGADALETALNAHPEGFTLKDGANFWSSKTEPEKITDGTYAYTVTLSGYYASTNPTYTVTVPANPNGTVSVSPRSATAGTTITVTVTPKEGYSVDTVTATQNGTGTAVTVTKNADGTYSFTMPAGGATVKATFVEGEKVAPSAKFTDVVKDAWYVEAIDYVVEKGLMGGTGETTFAPNDQTDRAMLVTILYRLDGEPAVTKDIPFSDVPAGKWYSDAINWAAANEIVGGYGDGTFRPDRDLTREEAATILYRYATYKKYDVTTTAELTAYTDAASVQSYATAPMSWAVGTELIGGTTATTLAPNGGAIRAQIATILMRFCENIVK